MSASETVTESCAAAAAEALRRGAARLLALQRQDGCWCGELTAGAALEPDYILLQLWLHQPQDGVWNPPERSLIDKAAQSILARQSPGGGFSIYPGGPAEVSASVKAYFALKLAGLDAGGRPLRLARERILRLGGIQAANSFVKLNLSLFGLYPRRCCPSIPPEMILLPGKFFYQMSAWTRATLAPLSVVLAANARRQAPSGFNLEELFLPGVSPAPRGGANLLSCRGLFLLFDKLLKLWERRGSQGLRRRAVQEAERWILDRTRCSDGLGAIHAPMMYTIMALDVLGYPRSHPDFLEAESRFRRLLVDDGRGFFFQPCFTPVRDTAIAAYALSETGGELAGALGRAADWLLSREVRRKGDWSVKRPDLEPSGWCLEFANEFYPDIDDTAMALLALQRAARGEPARARDAMDRALRWLVGMQSKNGGWAAFDVDSGWAPLAEAPFAVRNAVLDQACPDITGRVLEALCACGLDRGHPAVGRGVRRLIGTQEADGGWSGRWGVNYIYGTFLALRGLRAAGEDEREAHILRAGEWLRSVQNLDGGWGESCASYESGAFVAAGSTPSQTAWALLGLLASGDARSRSVEQGIAWLLAAQRPDGGWDEDLATGTGLPGCLYLSYGLYRLSFPLLALAGWLKARGKEQTKAL